jgi:hypothetical protein
VKAQVVLERLSQTDVNDMVLALKTVSFYASINHGTKCKDYGEIVDPTLKRIGIAPGGPL